MAGPPFPSGPNRLTQTKRWNRVRLIPGKIVSVVLSVRRFLNQTSR
jgi:hypothetical protein